MTTPTAWVFAYADDRELDVSAITALREDQIRSGKLKLLRTGVGKARAAMATTTYLTGRLRNRQSRPTVVSIGTCAAIDPSLDLSLDKIVRPSLAVDRDATPELLHAANIRPQPVIQLEDPDDLELTIGTGDGFLADPLEAKKLLDRGIQLVDMETHAVAWASLQCLAGPALSVRYVSDVAGTGAERDWVQALAKARAALTEYVLSLTS